MSNADIGTDRIARPGPRSDGHRAGNRPRDETFWRKRRVFYVIDHVIAKSGTTVGFLMRRPAATAIAAVTGGRYHKPWRRAVER